MLRLDATNRSLEVILAAAVTTNQLNCTASYSDKTAIAYTGGSAYTNTNSAVAVTLVAAPSASTVRDIDMVNIYNADTVSARVTVRVNDNTTMRVLGVFTLNSQDTLRYTHASGWEVLNSSGAQKVVLNAAASGLTCYLLPSLADGWRSIYRAGFDWWSRNQQWGGPFGGELVDAATGTMYKTEVATQYFEDNTTTGVADSAGHTYVANGFKVPETQTIAAIWVKLYKTGNPTGNLTLYVLSDDGTGTKPTGSTPITNGTSTAISGKNFTGDTNGQFYRFSFSTPPSCTGGTQYHWALKSSAAVDGSNYWVLRQTDSKRYPFGNLSNGDATPTWTAASTNSASFYVELSTGQILQASGIYDGKLAFGGSGASGTLSMSRGLCNAVPLRELIPDPTEFTVWIAGTAFSKDATILDIGYGEDHDRIVLRSNITTGYGQVDVYENDGQTGSAAKTTVTASATDLSSGNHYIGVYVRAKNDGSDRIDLYIDGTTYSSATNLSLSFDTLLRELGTMWVGGGFAVAVTDTLKTTMSALPSNGAVWTWTGTGTEANCMSVSGNVLYQNKNGYASTDTGYYSKSSLSLSNANGHSERWMANIVSSTNTALKPTAVFASWDGTGLDSWYMHEYYLQPGDINTGSYFFPQKNLKGSAHTFHAARKGTTVMLFADRKLLVDGTGQSGTGTALNKIEFGDESNTASENADAQWKYVAYYNTAWNPPQFTSGSISELAIWQGNMKALWPLLYNSGSPVSAKQLLGIPSNYLDKSAKIPAIDQIGITNTTTVSGTVPEMEAFVICDDVNARWQSQTIRNTSNVDQTWNTAIDGVQLLADGGSEYVTHQNGFEATSKPTHKRLNLGLHKVEGKLTVGSGTVSVSGQARRMVVESRL